MHLMAELRRAALPTGMLPERVDVRTGHPHLDHSPRLVSRLRDPRAVPALAPNCIKFLSRQVESLMQFGSGL
jgi:hypothetical protein